MTETVARGLVTYGAGMDRRDFLRFAGMGLTLPVAGSLLSACGGDDTSTASASGSPTTAGAAAVSSTAPGTTSRKKSARSRSASSL
jgi:hypothetical protein